MRFASTCALLLAASVEAFRPTAFRARTTNTPLQSTAAPEETSKSATKKDERLRMMKSQQFHRKGFKEVREDVESTMMEQFKGEIVEDLRKSNYVMERDGVKVYLAKVRL